MLIKPSREDISLVLYHIGRIILLVGIFLIFPFLTAIFFQEKSPGIDFLLSLGIFLNTGFFLILFFKIEKELRWMHAMVITSLSWLFIAVLGAIPFYLSGNWKSFLDAVFEAMSGLATTGLTLAEDLDHLSLSCQMWRHLLMFIGGQGVIIMALSFLGRGLGGVFRIYVGEAREEKIFPNVVETARFIWILSIFYLILGSLVLGGIAFLEGVSLKRAFFQGICLFMAAFDTGGFTPHSQNILYYHSFFLELATIFMMFLGVINFNLHYNLWTGKRREFWRDIEIITFSFTVIFTFLLVAIGLSKAGIYPQARVLFRKGFYQLISAHTGTGYANVYSREFLQFWPGLAMVGLIMAMGLGGATCSTTGGIKALRIGLVFRAFLQDVKQLMQPDNTVLIEKFHHIRDLVLEDRYVRSAAIIFLAYLILYFSGTIVGMLCGYPFLDSLFESTSAGANVGLSCGITSPQMPTILKLTYIFQMWLGRLEFVAIFTLIGFIIALVRGK
ncbi:MAG: TrkH family potassium uptake protein [Candidatus Omnitrophica bacterium]|nr:TrkH family potassium uptake protein [Candidatus Omnitrophota bacterium]MCM8792846.1 TrkH family potassium uptake protein [Candidatus Omnitrophota bacterium]